MVKPGIPAAARAAAVATAVAVLALASACSSGKSSSAKSSPSSPPSTSGTSGTSSPSSTTVNSGSATVNGVQTTVLTAPDGHTLYYFIPDNAAGQPTCTGICAAMWPPLKAAKPTESTIAIGALSVVGDGQVAYNGHPLYEFSGDSAAGQAKGEGFAGKWYAATPALAPGAGTPGPSMTTGPSTSSSPSSPSTSSGGNSSGSSSGGGSY